MEYRLLEEDTITYKGETLYRVQYLKDSEYFKAGYLGGYVDKNTNLQGSLILEGSKVIKSTIAKNSIIDDATIIKSTIFAESTITKSMVKGSGVVASILIHANITESEIISSEVATCTISNSRIELVDAKNVHLYNLFVRAATRINIYNYSDYLQFKNWWSSGRYFCYIPANKTWYVGCFQGTHDELIAKAYKDSKDSGDHYKAIVELVRNQGL